jgi:hypothetical protein
MKNHNPHLFDIIFVGSKFLKHPVRVCVTHARKYTFLFFVASFYFAGCQLRDILQKTSTLLMKQLLERNILFPSVESCKNLNPSRLK